MRDEIAIVTKAKENIIFAMAELSEGQRIAMSVEKRKFIQKCSFNGMECNIDKWASSLLVQFRYSETPQHEMCSLNFIVIF